MPPWISQISSAQKKEGKSNTSRFVQLATIGFDSRPRVRTVVFRGWSDKYEMELFTDKRSQKYFELELNNNVEVCWFFSKSKCQFRLRGESKFDCGMDKQRYWNQLDDHAKSMWSWPTPGEYCSNDLKEAMGDMDDTEMIENFILLKIKINRVEQLLLRHPRHIRKQWERGKEWVEQHINP